MSLPTEQKPFQVRDYVVYEGKTYTFFGEITAIALDGQCVVQAINPNGTYFKGMKHIFGPSQLRHAEPEDWHN